MGCREDKTVSTLGGREGLCEEGLTDVDAKTRDGRGRRREDETERRDVSGTGI